MKKIVVSIVLLAVIVAFGTVSYNYLIIRKGTRVFFMEKSPGTFDRVYLDVSEWSFMDYGLHPKISAFLAAEGVRETGNSWKNGFRKKVDSAKKELNELKEKVTGN